MADPYFHGKMPHQSKFSKEGLIWVHAFVVHRKEGMTVDVGASGPTAVPDNAKRPRYVASQLNFSTFLGQDSSLWSRTTTFKMDLPISLNVI